MYCGTKIAGYPISTAPDCVSFAFEDVSTGRILGYLDMFHFKETNWLICLDMLDSKKWLYIVIWKAVIVKRRLLYLYFLLN